MSLPVSVPRRAFSYDDGLEDTAPMTPPPADLCANVLWKQPVIPERKYQELSKVGAGRLPRWPWPRRASCVPLQRGPGSPPAWLMHRTGRAARRSSDLLGPGSPREVLGTRDRLCCLALLWERCSVVEIGVFWEPPRLWEAFTGKKSCKL